MSWIELTLEVPPHEHPERYENALLAAGALSVTLTDAADTPVLEPGPGETPLWPATRVTGLFPSAVSLPEVERAVAEALGGTPVLHTNPLEERDWTRAWMDGFHPMAFGRRLWVVPEGFAAPDPQGVNLRLDPGLAFGTGTHPTTALCLQWLDAHPPVDRDVIDYGCGSGVLAVAAVLLGARHARAVDNDPQALLATRDNAAKNDVAERITTAAPEHLDDAPTDVLLANILASPLVELAPAFAARVRPGGLVVLSGVLAEQVSQVTQAYAPWFIMAPATLHEGWARLEGVRKSDTV